MNEIFAVATANSRVAHVLHINIPDPDDMNEQRALWAEVALREFTHEVSGPQGMADTRNLDNVAASFFAISRTSPTSAGGGSLVCGRRARSLRLGGGGLW